MCECVSVIRSEGVFFLLVTLSGRFVAPLTKSSIKDEAFQTDAEHRDQSKMIWTCERVELTISYTCITITARNS